MTEEFSPELRHQMALLQERYQALNQDLTAYAEGWRYMEFLTYWDYIHLDTLLTLQNPKTAIPDEKIFIMYHQITELYFRLCLHEYEQIASEIPTVAGLKKRAHRINRYFENLIRSFEVMVDGMDLDQFLQFRLALMPASGFQSAQYRMIEICSTDMRQLVARHVRPELPDNASIEQMMEVAYWKWGATESATGTKTLTLLQFEEKYHNRLVQHAKEYERGNLWVKYNQLSEADQKDPELLAEIKELDMNVNVTWPLMHYKSAVRYLQKKPSDIPATGGTNWPKYLAPRMQKRVFYPSLWTEAELENWGKPLEREAQKQ
jgi:tryptophan 2,3-dioxygenase